MTLEPSPRGVTLDETPFEISVDYTGPNDEEANNVDAEVALRLNGAAKPGYFGSGDQMSIEVESNEENVLITLEKGVSLKDFGEWLIEQQKQFERWQKRNEMFWEWFYEKYDLLSIPPSELDNMRPKPNDSWSESES